MIRQDQMVVGKLLHTTHTFAVNLWTNRTFHRLTSGDLAIPNKFAGFKKAEATLPNEVAELRMAVQLSLVALEKDQLTLVGMRVIQKDEITEVQLLLADPSGSKSVLKISANAGSFEHTLLPFADFMGRAPLSDTLSSKPTTKSEPPDSLANLFATLESLRRQ